jgi:hypothetical protein
MEMPNFWRNFAQKLKRQMPKLAGKYHLFKLNHAFFRSLKSIFFGKYQEANDCLAGKQQPEANSNAVCICSFLIVTHF